MMKRPLFVCTALGMLVLLVVPDGAYAQRRGGSSGRGEGGRGWSGGGERGWEQGRGGDWNRGGGFGYGLGYGQGYGSGYYGNSYYGNRSYGGGYPYSSYYGGYGYGYQPYSNYDSGYGYQQPYYTYDQNSTPSYDYTYSDQGSRDGYNAGRSNNTVALRVMVPDANAKVWVEGQETQQKGSDRLFISPPLERGKSYNYTVKAQWNQDGREVTREKTVPVQVGQQAVANFSQNQNQGERRMRTGTQYDQTDGTDRTKQNRHELDNSNRHELDNRSNRHIEDSNTTDRTRSGAHRQFDASHPFTGKVVSMNDDQVIVKDAQGNEHTFRIPASADVMIQGNKGSASGLKSGMNVTITPETDNTGVATKIEATSQNRNQGAKPAANNGNTNRSTNRPPQ